MKNSDKTRSLSECDREFEIRDFSTSQRGGVLLQTAILLLSLKSTKIQSTSKKRNGMGPYVCTQTISMFTKH